jgi:hypothetical protein
LLFVVVQVLICVLRHRGFGEIMGGTDIYPNADGTYDVCVTDELSVAAAPVRIWFVHHSYIITRSYPFADAAFYTLRGLCDHGERQDGPTEGAYSCVVRSISQPEQVEEMLPLIRNNRQKLTGR